MSYRPEEWIGGRWEPLGRVNEDLARSIWLCDHVQRHSGNSVRVVNPRTGEVLWMGPKKVAAELTGRS